MRVAQEKVRLFHEKYGFPAPDAPTLVDPKMAAFRYSLIYEELQEYLDATDLVGVADALADLAYTVLGTAVVHGIPLERVFNEVHRSNMTKTVGGDKPAKGPSFHTPRIAEVLFLEVTGLNDQVDVGNDVPGGGAI